MDMAQVTLAADDVVELKVGMVVESWLMTGQLLKVLDVGYESWIGGAVGSTARFDVEVH